MCPTTTPPGVEGGFEFFSLGDWGQVTPYATANGINMGRHKTDKTKFVLGVGDNFYPRVSSLSTILCGSAHG